MGDKPSKHSVGDTLVQGLNLLDIPHSIIHVILSYLDKNSLVAVSQSCQTLKIMSDRKSTRLNSSHPSRSRMPSSA